MTEPVRRRQKNAQHPASNVGIMTLAAALRLNIQQLAFMLRISHRTLARWANGTPQAAWFELAVKGAVGTFHANPIDTFNSCNWGGYGSHKELIAAYDLAVDNKRGSAKALTNILDEINPDPMDLNSL